MIVSEWNEVDGQKKNQAFNKHDWLKKACESDG